LPSRQRRSKLARYSGSATRHWQNVRASRVAQFGVPAGRPGNPSRHSPLVFRIRTAPASMYRSPHGFFSFGRVDSLSAVVMARHLLRPGKARTASSSGSGRVGGRRRGENVHREELVLPRYEARASSQTSRLRRRLFAAAIKREFSPRPRLYPARMALAQGAWDVRMPPLECSARKRDILEELLEGRRNLRVSRARSVAARIGVWRKTPMC